MTNRIVQVFKRLTQENKKAFIAFITAGDPSLNMTEDLVFAFENIGVDILELGVPFSDPIADGSTIQASSQRALDKGVNLTMILNLVNRVRKRSNIPIALMMYYNHILFYGEEAFIKECRRVGVDGLIIPDLPPEEGEALIRIARKYAMATVFFISPTTSILRAKKIVKKSTGFIYYVLVEGVTGARSSIGMSYVDQVKNLKQHTNIPVCVGFGISSKEQVKEIIQTTDGVIVGSSIINEIQKYKDDAECVAKVSRFVKILRDSACI